MGDSAAINVNAWYISKIFIGEINRATKRVRFRKEVLNELLVHYRDLPGNGIAFETIEESTKRKDRSRSVNAALTPIPQFYKKDSFRWMLNYVSNTPTNAVSISNNSFIVVPKKGIYFALASPWDDRSEMWIRYRYNRLATKIFCPASP